MWYQTKIQHLFCTLWKLGGWKRVWARGAESDRDGKVKMRRNWAWEKRNCRERGVHCAAEGSGRPGQSRQRSAAQISSEADSSLTGIRGPAVNNRGSDLGHLGLWQSAHFSSITLPLCVLWDIFISRPEIKAIFHMVEEQCKVEFFWSSSSVNSKRNIQISRKMKRKQSSRLRDRWHHWFKLNICGPDTVPALK